jgi:hypothetical protein
MAVSQMVAGVIGLNLKLLTFNLLIFNAVTIPASAAAGQTRTRTPAE